MALKNTIYVTEDVGMKILTGDYFGQTNLYIVSGYDTGAFVYNGEYIKDMYYDYAKVCIPCVSELI